MQWIDYEKNYYIFFLRIFYINDRFNFYSTISYYNNVKHIKDNIYEAEAKGNYFRLVTLANISAGYPCINFSRTQWVKNNNRPYYSQELKRVLAWPSSHYSNYPWSFFFLHGESCSSWCRCNFNFFFIYPLFFFINLKDVCVNVM